MGPTGFGVILTLKRIVPRVFRSGKRRVKMGLPDRFRDFRLWSRFETTGLSYHVSMSSCPHARPTPLHPKGKAAALTKLLNCPSDERVLGTWAPRGAAVSRGWAALCDIEWSPAGPGQCVLTSIWAHGFAGSPCGARGVWTGSWIWHLAEACRAIAG